MPTDPRNLLIVHVAGLAQTTLALPALRSLRNHLPEARITVATSAAAADLLRLAQCADEILPVGRLRGAELLNPKTLYRGAKSLGEVRRGLYDLAIEFRKNTEGIIVLQLAHPLSRIDSKRRALGGVIEKVTESLIKRLPPAHLAQEYLRRLEPLGVRPIEAEPRVATDRIANEQLERLLGKHGFGSGELLVGIHPGAGAGAQRWPIERFASIASRMIHNFNARVLVFAGPNEKGQAKRIVATLPAKRAIAVESPKLLDFVSAAARLSLFIGNAAGPAHVAAAAGAPVVAVSTSVDFSPQDVLGPRVELLRAPHPALISEEAVYEAACRLLKTNRAEHLRAR